MRAPTIAEPAQVATAEVLGRVVLAGRPNVGKSSLANRLAGSREAIVEASPGVTRDRKLLRAEWRGEVIELVDTGGLLRGGAQLDRQVTSSSLRAIGEADLVLLVVDVTVGVTEEEEAACTMLRRLPGAPPVVVVANKSDSLSRSRETYPFLALGFGDALPVSAMHGRGTGDLLDRVVEELRARRVATPAPVVIPGTAGEGEPGRVISVALIGRPNVGKSTLFNRLVGEERSITHDMPGTTRDTIDTVVETPAGVLRFVDTAGLRRPARQSEAIEYYSVVRAFRAIDEADVALLLIDSTEGVTGQEARLAERVDAAGSPIVVVANKWDRAGAEQRLRVVAEVEERLGFIGYAPLLKISALTGKGAHKISGALAEAISAYRRRAPTGEVNRLLQAAQRAHPSPAGRVLYATQGSAEPPTFTLFTTGAVQQSYLRYLERKLREGLGLGPTPLKLRVRPRSS